MKTGTRLRSLVCDGEVVIVRAENITGAIECGGHPMSETREAGATACPIAEGLDGGLVLGKRYEFVGDGQRLEVLVTKAGKGTVALEGVPLVLKAAKALPSSD